MDGLAVEEGCDLRQDCGFFYASVQGKSRKLAAVIERYCGEDFFLCSRRYHLKKTGLDAPHDMTPLGSLPVELLSEVLKDD
jgi:hypothetical protein